MRRMKAFIAFLLLVASFGIIFPLSFAQQNQSTQKPNPEIDALKSRISVLENKLQTVENVEKIELMAKLAEANAKLANAEIDKYKRELRDANDKWLKSWSTWFLTIIGIFIAILIGVSAVFWFWLRSRADQLISDEVEKSLSDFKKAVAQLEKINNQLKVLQKEHAVSVLGHFRYYHPDHEPDYREQTALLPEEAILQVLSDKTRDLQLRHKAAEVLADRKSTRLVSPVLELLNSLIDDLDVPFGMEDWVRDFVNFVGQMSTEEAYQGLKKFFNRLLNDDTGFKSMLLTQTAVSLAQAGVELNKRDSLSILRKTIPDLDTFSHKEPPLKNFVEYFIAFNESEGIKDILTNGLTDRMPEVETRCLELLEEHDPDFVREWQAQRETTNTENEESE